MKVIIDIDEEDCDYLYVRKEVEGLEIDRYEEIILRGTPIPDRATNGDIVKAMFPYIESRLDEKTGIMLVKWTDGTTKTFKADWWNTLYKEEVE